MYCHYCKTKIDNDSLYCKHCGRQVVLDSEQMLRPRRRRRRPVAAVVLILLLLGLIGGGYWAVQKYMPELIPAVLEKVGIGAKKEPAAQTAAPSGAQTIPLPEEKASSVPLEVENGTVLRASAYMGECLLRVKANGSNVLAVLVYEGRPDATSGERTPFDPAYTPEEDRIALFIRGGKTADVMIPTGVYRLYYASGKSYYGTSALFGEATRRYQAGSLVICPQQDGSYGAVELTLHSTGGDGVTAVTAAAFPAID